MRTPSVKVKLRIHRTMEVTVQMNGNEQVWDTAGTHNGQDVVIMGGGWE